MEKLVLNIKGLSNNMLYEKEMYHYLILHFPIALFITGYLFDLISYFKPNSTYSIYAFYNLCLGVFSGILSIISGLITDQLVGHMDNLLPVWSTHGTHMIVAIILFTCFLILKILISKEKILVSSLFVLFLHSLILMFFIHGAHIGAKLANRI